MSEDPTENSKLKINKDRLRVKQRTSFHSFFVA